MKRPQCSSPGYTAPGTAMPWTNASTSSTPTRTSSSWLDAQRRAELRGCVRRRRGRDPLPAQVARGVEFELRVIRHRRDLAEEMLGLGVAAGVERGAEEQFDVDVAAEHARRVEAPGDDGAVGRRVVLRGQQRRMIEREAAVGRLQIEADVDRG